MQEMIKAAASRRHVHDSHARDEARHVRNGGTCHAEPVSYPATDGNTNIDESSQPFLLPNHTDDSANHLKTIAERLGAALSMCFSRCTCEQCFLSGILLPPVKDGIGEELLQLLFFGQDSLEVSVTTRHDIRDPESATASPLDKLCDVLREARTNEYSPKLSFDGSVLVRCGKGCNKFKRAATPHKPALLRARSITKLVAALPILRGLQQIQGTAFLPPSLDLDDIEYLVPAVGRFPHISWPVLRTRLRRPEIQADQLIDGVDPELLLLGRVLMSLLGDAPSSREDWDDANATRSINLRAQAIEPEYRQFAGSLASHNGRDRLIMNAIDLCFPFLTNRCLLATSTAYDRVLTLMEEAPTKSDMTQQPPALDESQHLDQATTYHVEVSTIEWQPKEPIPQRGDASARFDDGRLLSRAASEMCSETRLKAQNSAEWIQELKSAMELCTSRETSTHPVRIVVLDTGYAIQSPHFFDRHHRIKAVQNFTNGHEDITDVTDHDGHGSHGLDLLLGLARRADLLVGKVSNSFDLTSAECASIIKGLRWAALRRADIVCLPFGLYKDDPALGAAIDALQTKGTLVIAAASNDGLNRPRCYPAAYPGVIAAYACSTLGRPCDFNPKVDERENNFCVLGEYVRGVECAGTGLRSGTSVATVILAAVAAFLLDVVREEDSCSHVSRWLGTLDGMSRKSFFEWANDMSIISKDFRPITMRKCLPGDISWEQRLRETDPDTLVEIHKLLDDIQNVLLDDRLQHVPPYTPPHQVNPMFVVPERPGSAPRGWPVEDRVAEAASREPFPVRHTIYGTDNFVWHNCQHALNRLFLIHDRLVPRPPPRW
ncbi:hypothetical protein PWT90_07391 [Aphanocladium album]|nr:hypothetical protein PWT90_07391 [Aphanocladium album]